MRDITLGSTIYPRFTTRAFATGVPTTLAGTPVLSVYEENNLTQITAGVSLTVDYDSITGLNQATIVATSGNGYEAGKSYDVVITTGTVGGVSVVGEVVFSFTVEASAAVTRLGTPTGASIAADLVVIDNFVDELETRLTAVRAGYLDELAAANIPNDLTVITTHLTDIKGGTFSGVTDSLEAIRDRGDAAWITGPTASTIASAVTTDMDANSTQLAAIVEDTNELQTDWVNGGRLDLLLDTIIADIAALNNISAADVNAQVLDVLNTDTFAELGAVPAATSTLIQKITWLFMLARNQLEQTETTTTVRADDTTTAVASATVADNGTTATRGEFS